MINSFFPLLSAFKYIEDPKRWHEIVDCFVAYNYLLKLKMEVACGEIEL